MRGRLKPRSGKRSVTAALREGGGRGEVGTGTGTKKRERETEREVATYLTFRVA